MDLISVVVPIYNVAFFLDRCIKSVVGQSFHNLEIILVDDGSTDGCSEMCDNWAALDRRIVVVHQENAGRGAARNTGILRSNGNYICFVDGDDTIAENHIETLYKALIETDADMSVCCFTNVYSGGKRETIDDPYNESRFFDATNALTDMYRYTYGVWVSFCNKLVRRSYFDNLRFPEDKRLFEDWTLAPMLISKMERIYYVNTPSYFYDIHDEGSAMHSQTTKRHFDCVLGDLDHLAYFHQKNEYGYDDLIKVYLSSDFYKCIKCFSYSREDTAYIKEAYKEVKRFIPSVRIKLLYVFRYLLPIVSKIKNYK